jgi:hypothetical protein
MQAATATTRESYNGIIRMASPSATDLDHDEVRGARHRSASATAAAIRRRRAAWRLGRLPTVVNKWARRAHRTIICPSLVVLDVTVFDGGCVRPSVRHRCGSIDMRIPATRGRCHHALDSQALDEQGAGRRSCDRLLATFGLGDNCRRLFDGGRVSYDGAASNCKAAIGGGDKQNIEAFNVTRSPVGIRWKFLDFEIRSAYACQMKLFDECAVCFCPFCCCQ